MEDKEAKRISIISGVGFNWEQLLAWVDCI
jgi:hypothetical protein